MIRWIEWRIILTNQNLLNQHNRNLKSKQISHSINNNHRKKISFLILQILVKYHPIIHKGQKMYFKILVFPLIINCQIRKILFKQNKNQIHLINKFSKVKIYSFRNNHCNKSNNFLCLTILFQNNSQPIWLIF